METSSSFSAFRCPLYSRNENIYQICENLQIYTRGMGSVYYWPLNTGRNPTASHTHTHCSEADLHSPYLSLQSRKNCHSRSLRFRWELLPSRVSKIITGIRLLCSALCCLERRERKGVLNWQCWALNRLHFRRPVQQQAYIQQQRVDRDSNLRWCSCCIHVLQPKLWLCFEIWRIFIKFIFWFDGKKN